MMSTTEPEATPRTEAPANPRRLLVIFAVLSLATLGIGGALTSMGFGSWYDALAKPSFQPPAWVFSPAWTLIFALLAVATWQIAKPGHARIALGLYAAQLLLNVGWSLFFFALHDPALALVDIALLDLVVLGMVVTYFRIRRSAGWMLVPYAVWLGLATSINAWIVANN